MNTFNTIYEGKDLLSRDFEVGQTPFAKQTKMWLKSLDAAVEQNGFTYDQCREAAKKFKHGDFEGALKTIWGKKLEIEIKNSENGGSSKVKYYDIIGYGSFTEKLEYKNGSYVGSITGSYVNCSAPGYSLGTIVSFSGRGEGDLEILADKACTTAMQARNTANIYNILFVGVDVPSKIISKPMLKLKKSL